MKRLQQVLAVAIAGLFAGTLPAFAVTDFERGNELYAKGQYHAAVDAYVDAICATPKSYVPHYQLANTYMKLGRLSEAQTEYEMVLEMYPDARTKSLTRKALHYITGSAKGNAAVQDHDTPEHQRVLDARLAAEKERLAIADKARADEKAKAIQDAAAKHADQIKANAKAQIEQMKQNSSWWAMNGELNDRVGVIPAEVSHDVMERAEAAAEKVKEQAKAKAQAVTPANTADIAEGLRSQIYMRGNSNVRLSPVGTNVYVRNYQTTKKVATSADGVQQ